MIQHVDSQGKVSTITDLAIDLIKETKKIKEEKEAGTTELALASGLSKSQVSRFFNFKINLSLNKFLAVVDTLGYKVVLVPKHKKVEL